MKNGQIIEDGGKKRMYLNGAYFIYEPIKGNIKSLIASDIDTLYKMTLILSQAGKIDPKYFQMQTIIFVLLFALGITQSFKIQEEGILDTKKIGLPKPFKIKANQIIKPLEKAFIL